MDRSTPLTRLGEVLYWAGSTFAVLALGFGLLMAYFVAAANEKVFVAAIGAVIAALGWLVGRACKYSWRDGREGVVGLKAAVGASALALLLTACQTTGAPKPQTSDATKIRDQFDSCVYTSAGNLIRAKVSTDVNTIAESAFQACATEEQAIIQFMRLNGFSELTISTMTTKIRIDVKNMIKRIVADPAYRDKLS